MLSSSPFAFVFVYGIIIAKCKNQYQTMRGKNTRAGTENAIANTMPNSNSYRSFSTAIVVRCKSQRTIGD
jgi:hypothetical protein